MTPDELLRLYPRETLCMAYRHRGSPALLVKWAGLPLRVGDGRPRRHEFARSRPLNRPLQRTFPYFGSRFTKSAGEPR